MSPPTATVTEDSKVANKATTHTLPASWWTSEKIFDLERRSIFSKAWLYTCHRTKFAKPGDYQRFEVAGFSYFLILDKEGNVNGFHNVCRHRAYPVVRKDSGSALVLGCKYHGWSYNTKGNLTKAPQFDKVEGFDKSVNGLYSIHVHVTKQGFIFVNLDSAPKEEIIPFDKWFGDLEDQLAEFDFDDYEHHMVYELDGQFNWKTLMDGYEECYHCPTGHANLSKAFEMSTYEVKGRTNYARHYAQLKNNKTGQVNRGGNRDGLWLYLFPNAGLNCYSPAFYTIRVIPISVSHTILKYEIYKKKGIDKSEIDDFVDFLLEVEKEDFDLCEATQKNLNMGVYSSGQLHPIKEKGVLFYQDIVRDMVVDHLKLEKQAGHEILPAARKSGELSEQAAELDKLCRSLECANTDASSVLAW